MKQITAYEVEGKLFKTEQEARQHILEKKLNEHFRNKDAYDLLRKIIRNKETRDFLIKAFQECDSDGDLPTREEAMEVIKGIIDNTYRCAEDVYAMNDNEAMNELRAYYTKLSQQSLETKSHIQTEKEWEEKE